MIVHELDERGFTLSDVPEQPGAHEGDACVAELDEVLERGLDARPVVDVHGGYVEGTRPLPQRDDRDDGVPQVLEQPWLILHVAEEEDRIAMPRLEHGRQRDRLIRPAMRVTEHEVVAARPRFLGQRFDRPCEERVGDVADDGPEQHRRGAAKATRERVRPVAELAGSIVYPRSRLVGDGHPRRDIVEHA